MKKFLLFFTLISTITFSQWFQVETKTNSFLLNGAFINEDCGYLVGEKGVLLKTTNGGTDWKKIVIVENVRLNDVKVLNDNYNTVIVCAENGFVYKSKDDGKTWSGKQVAYSPLRSIDVKNKTVVTTGGSFFGLQKISTPGNSKVYYSNDYGETWEIKFDSWNFTALSIELVTEDIWFIVGSNNQVFKTTDRGMNWNFVDAVYSLPYSWWFSIKFIDEQTGYLTGGMHGQFGVVAKTTNSGNSWVNISPVVDELVTNIDFTDANNITVVAGDYYTEVKHYILQTEDGGSNWRSTSLSNLALYYVKMFDKNKILTSGKFGSVYLTCNGGGSVIDTSFTWDVVQQGKELNVNSVQFNYDGVGLGFADNGKVLRYTLDGRDYSIDSLGYSDLLVSDKYNSNIWVAGRTGGLFHSTDNGINWQDISLSFNSDIKSISFINDSTGYLTNDDYLYSTSDQGLTWNTTYDTAKIVKAKDNIIAIINRFNGLKLSKDYGKTWNTVFFTYNNITAISIFDENNIVLASELGEIYICDINGNVRKLGSGNYKFNDIKHFDSDNVICAGFNIVDNRGLALKYNINTKQLFGIKHFPFPLNSVSLINEKGWISGNNGFLLFSSYYEQPMPELKFTSVDSKNDDYVPSNFELEQNYPNPFNPITNISFSLNKNEMVVLAIYDVQGRIIETLVNQQLKAGKYNVIFDGSGLASGTYFYRIITEGNSVTKKLVLLK